MKKNIVLLSSLAFFGTSLTTAATIFLGNNNSIFANATDNQTVGHTIVFSANDERTKVDGGRNYQGFDCTLEHATRSGFPLTIYAGVVGSGLKSNNVEGYLLYCETKGESASEPDNTLEIEFDFKQFASFESVVIRGEIYTNNAKTELIDNYAFTLGDGFTNYYENQQYISIQNKGFFKAYITTIEINYTCLI